MKSPQPLEPGVDAARTAMSAPTEIADSKGAQAAYEAVLAEKNLVLDALPVGVAFVENRVIERCNARL